MIHDKNKIDLSGLKGPQITSKVFIVFYFVPMFLFFICERFDILYVYCFIWLDWYIRSYKKSVTVVIYSKKTEK